MLQAQRSGNAIRQVWLRVYFFNDTVLYAPPQLFDTTFIPGHRKKKQVDNLNDLKTHLIQMSEQSRAELCVRVARGGCQEL